MSVDRAVEATVEQTEERIESLKEGRTLWVRSEDWPHLTILIGPQGLQVLPRGIEDGAGLNLAWDVIETQDGEVLDLPTLDDYAWDTIVNEASKRGGL